MLRPQLLLLVCWLWVSACFGAAAQSVFRKTFGGPGRDVARSVRILPDGGYLVAGSTEVGGQEDGLLLRLDASGDLVWQHQYGGAAYDLLTDCIVAHDGGYLCLGQTRSFGAGGLDIWWLKVDEAGQVEWSKTYGTATDDQAARILALPPDAYCTFSNGTPHGATQFDALGLKINTTGDALWSRSYSNAVDNLLPGLIPVATPDRLWAGGIYQMGSGMFEGMVAEINLNTGGLERGYRYGPTLGSLYYLAAAGEGRMMIADAANPPGSSDRWAWAMTFHPNGGEVAWSYRYGLPGHQYRCRAAASPDGGFALAMYDALTPSSYPASDAILARLSAEGELLWAFDYGGPGSDRWFDIVPAADGGWLLCGATDLQDATRQDIVLVKTDRAGYAGLCCTAPVSLVREEHPVSPQPLSVLTLPWASAKTQNTGTQQAQMETRTNTCAYSLGLSLVTEPPTCTQGGSIEVRVDDCPGCLYGFGGVLTQANVFSALKPGTYTLQVQASPTCSADTSVVLSLTNTSSWREVPNAFTPDGDGVNDRFRPLGMPLCAVLVQRLRVFDRWGRQVFEQSNFSTDDESAGWAGEVQQQPAPADVYAYLLEYTDAQGSVQKSVGHVTLLR